VANPLDEPSPEIVKGILINPIYIGVGPFPRLVEDKASVRACAKLIQEDGGRNSSSLNREICLNQFVTYAPVEHSS